LPFTHAESSARPEFDNLPTKTANLPNGVGLCYVEEGQGLPLVFIHGLLGDWRSWQPQWDAFVARGYRCISYSRRYSFPNVNEIASPNHSALIDADDLAGLLDALGIPAAILVGTSYGAFTALALAVHHPQRVVAMVATEAPMMKYADFSKEGAALRVEFERRTEAAVQAFRQGSDAQAVRMMTEAINGSESSSANTGYALQRRIENVNAMRALMLSTDPFPLLSPQQLRGIAAPTLLVIGEQTQPIHEAVFRNVCAAMPQARVGRVQGAGHGVHRDKPQEFNAIALEFLQHEIRLAATRSHGGDKVSLSATPLTSAERIAQFECEQDMCDLWDNLLSRSIYAAFQQSASAFGPATAITFVHSSAGPDRSISYKQLLEGITRTANFLGDVGGRGCGVAYMLPASIETHFLLWGAESVGYAVPLNPFLLPAEIVALVKAAGCKLFVIPKTDDPEIAKRTEAVRQAVPGIRVVAIGLGPLPPSAIDFEQQVVRYPSGEATHFDAVRSAMDTIAYFHTGGTTGTPKLVAHTSRNQLAAAAGAAAMLHLGPGQRLTNGMPMFHVGGTVASSLAPFLAGAQIVVMSGQGFRNPEMISGIWKVVERCKVTSLAAVPTAMGALLNTKVDADISSIRWGLTGAASCPQSVTERFHQVTGAGLHEVLGMTETGGVTSVDPVGDSSTVGSVGFRLPHTRLRVRNLLGDGALGADCDADEIGVLFVEGAHVSSGYLDPTQNEGVFVEGGLNTGDLAYFGENGKLFVAGRSKDLIIRSGHNIDPAMIENACASHPAVALAAAVGQPDAYAGELPVVFLSLKPGHKADIPELSAHARERIAEKPAWPKSVYVVDSIPVTAVGKIYKPALRAEAARRSLTDQIAKVAPEANFQVDVASAGKRGLHVSVELSATDEASRSAVEAFLKAHTFSWSLKEPS